MRFLKTLLLVIVAALAVYVAYGTLKRPAAPPPSAKEPGLVFEGPGPFDGLGLRFDGYYRFDRGSLRYLMRFFPEGRVVLVTGAKDVESTLPGFLTRDTQGNPSIGLHNVMADVRGDSIFFVTRPVRGEISYRGKAIGDSLVLFHRHSHITGEDLDMRLRFHPDDAASGEQPS